MNHNLILGRFVLLSSPTARLEPRPRLLFIIIKRNSPFFTFIKLKDALIFLIVAAVIIERDSPPWAGILPSNQGKKTHQDAPGLKIKTRTKLSSLLMSPATFLAFLPKNVPGGPAEPGSSTRVSHLLIAWRHSGERSDSRIRFWTSQNDGDG